MNLKKLIFSFLLINSFLYSNEFNKQVDKALINNEKVYILIESDDCSWCKKFKKNVLNKSEFKKYMNDKKYSVIVMNRDNVKIPKKYNSTRVPQHYFLSKDEIVLFEIAGYVDFENFKLIVEKTEKTFQQMY